MEQQDDAQVSGIELGAKVVSTATSEDRTKQQLPVKASDDSQYPYTVASTSASTAVKDNTVQDEDRDPLVELIELDSFGNSSSRKTPSEGNNNLGQDNNRDNVQTAKMWRLALDFTLDWLCTIFVGFLVVSYWRGTWTLLDSWSCNQPGSAGMVNGEAFCFVGFQPDEHAEIRRKSAWHSLVAGYGLLGVGIYAMNQGWWQPGSLRLFFHLSDPSVRSTMSASTVGGKTFRVTKPKTVQRFAMVYFLGNGTVCLWRGIWYILDAHVLPNDLILSYWTTTIAGAALCFALCSGASLLAPPAIFLLDGPSRSAPPLANTILMSYRSLALPAGEADIKNEQDPMYVVVLDMTLSYLVLPWGVVGFWRGFWSLMDNYLWEFSINDKDLHLSIVYSLVIGLFCLFIASDDIVQFIHTNKQKPSLVSTLASESVGRIRTMILAVGVVNVWRAFWYIWDVWLGETNVWSAALSHVLGVVLLFLVGCLSCITAPPSTIGVDAVAHPSCADDPLFHNIPVPNEALFVCAMGRSPDRILGPRACSEMFLPPPVPARLISSVRNVNSCFNLQSRDESISSMVLSRRHQSVRKSTEFFRSR